jgi:hypothetical protein
MSAPDDTLYGLLPAVHRVKDAELGYPLRTLLRAIGAQVDELAAEIDAQYRDWFIETCRAERVPAFAALVGVELGAPGGSAEGTIATRNAIARRRLVANAIADRRRKGSFSVLEQLAGDATGWPARAVELAPLLMSLPNVRFPGLGRHPLLHLGDGELLEWLDTPPSGVGAPLTDVRRLGSHRRPSLANPTGIAVWLWRLVADASPRAAAAAMGAANHFAFDPLGRRIPLCIVPTPRVAGSAPAGELDLAAPIGRLALERRVEDYYGPGRSLCVYRGRHPIPREEILVADLAGWRHPPPPGRVSLDPLLGRIAFPVRHPPAEEVWVSCATLSMGSLGAGHRSWASDLPANGPVFRVGQRAVGLLRSVSSALKAWGKTRASDPAGRAAVVEVVDDAVYDEPLDIELAPGERLLIRAAPGCRPIIWPPSEHRGRPDVLRVNGGRGSSLALQGLWIVGHTLELEGHLDAVSLADCTLLPARGLPYPDEPPDPRQASLIVRARPCAIDVCRCVVGRVVVDVREVGVDPLRLNARDSVLDASGGGTGEAIEGPDGSWAWVELTLARTTVLGGARVREVALVEDSIFTAPVRCERRQPGEVRSSFLAPASSTPRRTRCQPDLALRALDEAIARGEVEPSHRQRERRRTLARVTPRFDAVAAGTAAYARLVEGSPLELTRGAHDEGELGAYHDLWQALSVGDLRAQLADFAPIGSDIDIRFAT